MTSSSHSQPACESPTTSVARSAPWHGRLRTAGLLLVLALGTVAGMLVGRFSRAEKGAPVVTEPAWEYTLPDMSETIAESYRATIAETGIAVSAAMEAHPRSVSAVSALALVHNLAHDRVGEEKCWERCLELDPHHALAHTRLVALAQQNANYSRVMDLMQAALRHDPLNPMHRSMLGSALMYLNRPEEARIQLEKSIAGGNADAETFLVLGEVYNQLDRPAKAKKFLSLAVDLDPDRDDALYGLVKVCNKLGETQAAKDYLARFEQLKAERTGGSGARERLKDDNYVPPRVAEILTLVGKSHLESRDLTIAEKYFRQAAALSAQDAGSRKMLVQLMNNANNWQESLRWTKELQQLEPDHAVHRWNEGILNDRLKRYDESERVFRDFCRLRPTDPSGYSTLAALLLQGNRKLNEARSLAERAVELGPTAENYRLLGAVAQKQGDQSAARVAFKRAAELDPQNAELQMSSESAIREQK